MPFDDADAYGRFMGRFSEPLATRFLDHAELSSGARVLDVGCGPGALTRALADRPGVEQIAAIDPSPPFVAAVRRALPAVDAQVAGAEQLPFAADRFSHTLAQLVVHFMTDPAAGVAEMARVTRPGGVVAACVWDHASGRGPLSPYWSAAAELWPETVGEARRTGSSAGDLGRLWRTAGIEQVEEGEMSVTVHLDSFAAWFEPFTLGVGPAGEHYAGLGEHDRDRLEQSLRGRAPVGAFDVTVVAWTVRGRAR